MFYTIKAQQICKSSGINTTLSEQLQNPLGKSLIEAKSKYLAHLCMPTHFAGSIAKSGGVKLAKLS
jgi:hypothetical protein